MTERLTPNPAVHPPIDISDDAAVKALVARLNFEATQAAFDARDLFEVKVDIIRRMAVLDPSGDWLGRGAWALQKRSGGERSLETLFAWLSDLEQRGVASPVFEVLRREVFPGVGDEMDAQSSAGE
jgi:hypothetical protein